jgi:tetratricopeptide (TPR) repeat protein
MSSPGQLLALIATIPIAFLAPLLHPQPFGSWISWEEELTSLDQPLLLDCEESVARHLSLTACVEAATLLSQIGRVYEHLGQFNRALDYYEQAFGRLDMSPGYLTGTTTLYHFTQLVEYMF